MSPELSLTYTIIIMVIIGTRICMIGLYFISEFCLKRLFVSNIH
jgi:hypothetical protein